MVVGYRARASRRSCGYPKGHLVLHKQAPRQVLRDYLRRLHWEGAPLAFPHIATGCRMLKWR